MRHVVCIALLLLACLFWYPYLQTQIPAEKEIKQYSRSIVAEMDDLLRWADDYFVGDGVGHTNTEDNVNVDVQAGDMCGHTTSTAEGKMCRARRRCPRIVAPIHSMEQSNSTLMNVWHNMMASLRRYPLEKVIPLPFVYGNYYIYNISGVEKSLLADARFDVVCNAWILSVQVPVRVYAVTLDTPSPHVLQRQSEMTRRTRDLQVRQTLEVDVVMPIQVALNAAAPLNVRQVAVDRVSLVGPDTEDDNEKMLMVYQINQDRLRLGMYLRGFLNDYILYLPFEMLWRRIWDIIA